MSQTRHFFYETKLLFPVKKNIGIRIKKQMNRGTPPFLNPLKTSSQENMFHKKKHYST